MVSIDKYLKKDALLLKYARSAGENETDRIKLQNSGTILVFPVENTYMMNDLLTGFGRNGKEYDFSVYDRVLDRTWMDSRRVEMILMRLKYPEDLAPEKAAEYRGRINAKLEEVLRHLAADRNLPVLKLLAEEGFFNAENIEGCIETLERAGEREMMLWLMNWKNQEIGSDAFDFSL